MHDAAGKDQPRCLCELNTTRGYRQSQQGDACFPTGKQKSACRDKCRPNKHKDAFEGEMHRRCLFLIRGFQSAVQKRATHSKGGNHGT